MKPIHALALIVAAVLLAHPELHAQCAAPRPAGVPVAAPLHVDGVFFRDAAGRAVLLRGMNVSGTGKVPPFTLLSDPAQVTQLKTWGVDMIRLTFKSTQASWWTSRTGRGSRAIRCTSGNTSAAPTRPGGPSTGGRAPGA